MCRNINITSYSWEEVKFIHLEKQDSHFYIDLLYFRFGRIKRLCTTAAWRSALEKFDL